jgi:hypothetical protein
MMTAVVNRTSNLPLRAVVAVPLIFIVLIRLAITTIEDTLRHDSGHTWGRKSGTDIEP